MITNINNFLKNYITTDGVPLKQVLTPEDLNQMSVSLYHITKAKEQKDFDAISIGIFKALGENKILNSVYYPIQEIPFNRINTVAEETADIALLGYYCFMYFRVVHDLPVEKIMSVVNSYITQHIVNKDDTSKVNCNVPISNLIPINEEQYLRFNGKTIIPPFDEIKDNFIETISNLLIK